MRRASYADWREHVDAKFGKPPILDRFFLKLQDRWALRWPGRAGLPVYRRRGENGIGQKCKLSVEKKISGGVWGVVSGSGRTGKMAGVLRRGMAEPAVRGADGSSWREVCGIVLLCALAGINMQNRAGRLTNEMRGLERRGATRGLTRPEVHPSGETVSILTDCRLLEQCIHFVGSAGEWLSVGEAETGSGGDQPVKE